jgi:acetolactate synthase-1/2/3 large subunit
VHHEQSALMASEGYTRETGKLALNIVTTGPGGTNTITGLIGLWLDSIPGFVISGQVSSNQLSKNSGCRQIGDQEFDIVETIKSCTKYSIIITRPEDIITELEKAYDIAISGRPGPVWIDIPLDIQGSFIPNTPESKKCLILEDCTLSEKIEIFFDILNDSRKPIIVAGNGVRLSGAYENFNLWIKMLGIPVVTGPHSGVDVVDNNYEYYAGRIGILGQITSNNIVQESDLVIIMGSRCPFKMTGYNLEDFAPNAKKIIIDIDENEINKHSFNFDLKINYDLNSFIKQAIEIDFNLSIKKWQNFIIQSRNNQIYYYPKHKNMENYMSMYYFTYLLKEYLSNETIVTSNGTAHVVLLQTYRLNTNQRLFTNVGCASMGYGLPAAIGACIGRKNKVICFEGDGSIMMNLQELQTAKHNNLPLTIFIINNDGYLSIKMTQDSFFNGQKFASGKNDGVTLPNFEKIAGAFDIKYFSIRSNQEINQKLQEITSFKQLCIVELFCNPNEKHEPKVISKGIDQNGRVIPGSLNNMYISEGF